MSLLAAAGIYLILDVNSPLANRHLNRYEPWTTYNQNYLKSVFEVIQQFSYYNNTLGFFAGNEIINDKISAKNSPIYIKAVVRDIKNYMTINSPRFIPIGYSAADDLEYRMPVSEYLECVDHHPSEAIDFYGVNSYQWCGDQNIHSSGYDVLINDYKKYTKPVFFSEYGCNEVLPRKFTEVQALFSNQMMDTFCGGLIFEYSQEPNNYGLTQIHENNDIELLPDFFQYKKQLSSLSPLNLQYIFQKLEKSQPQSKIKKPTVQKCLSNYKNLDITLGIPKKLEGIDEIIQKGVNITNGKLIDVDLNLHSNKFRVIINKSEIYNLPNKIEKHVNFDVPNNSSNSELIKPRPTRPTKKPTNPEKPSFLQTFFAKLSEKFRKMLAY